jgi:hypothetical protein
MANKRRTITEESSASPKAAPKTTKKVVSSSKISVRAVRQGFYGNKLRKPGEVFSIVRKDKLPSWVIDASAPYTPDTTEPPRKAPTETHVSEEDNVL